MHSISTHGGYSSPRGVESRLRVLLVIVFGALATAVGGVAGFYVGALHEEWAWELAASRVPALENFQQASSFSEAVNAKDILQASAARLVAQLQIPAAHVAAQSAAKQPRGSTGSDDPFAAVIFGLRAGIEEFRGTEQELFLTQHLLWALHTSQALNDWLDVYLDVLHRHPTDPVVARSVTDAWRIAKSTGRVQDITKAFHHLQAIPLDLPAKRTIEYLLGETASDGEESVQ